MSPLTYATLKVRPTSGAAEGPSDSQVASLALAILGSSAEQSNQSYVGIPLDASPHDNDLVARLADELRELARTADHVLVDFCYPRAIASFAVPEWLLYRALGESLHDLLPGQRLFVYVDTLPQEGEQLYDFVSARSSHGAVQFIDADGDCIGPDLDDQETRRRIHASTAETQSNLLDSLSRRMIRWRGVFHRASRGRERYFKYQYAIASELAYGELARLLSIYASQHAVRAFVFADSNSGWLEPAISEAGTRAGIPWANLAHLEAPDAEIDPALVPYVDEVRSHLVSGLGGVCAVLPAYREGLTHLEVEGVLHRLGSDDPRILTVLADSDLVAKHGADGPWYRTIEVPRGRRTARIDYFLSAPIELLEPGDWRVTAAISLSEDHEISDEITSPGRVALWGLFSDYGVALEEPVPDGREPIRWYPRLAELSDWDAHWLLSVLVERICEELECEPEQLLLLLPDELNASRRMADLAVRVEGVRSAVLSRAEIQNPALLRPSVRQLVDDYARMVIVAVDEARVSGRTLDAISALVRGVRGRPCDGFATILATTAGDGRAGVSLFQWSPYLSGDSSECG